MVNHWLISQSQPPAPDECMYLAVLGVMRYKVAGVTVIRKPFMF